MKTSISHHRLELESLAELEALGTAASMAGDHWQDDELWELADEIYRATLRAPHAVELERVSTRAIARLGFGLEAASDVFDLDAAGESQALELARSFEAARVKLQKELAELAPADLAGEPA